MAEDAVVPGGCPTALAVVASVNVGLPRLHRLPAGFPGADGQETYLSACHKEPVTGPVRLDRLQLAGDGQADRKNHGGPDKAVHAHFTQHLLWWGQRRGHPLLPGEIGENLTLAPAPGRPPAGEAALCIGDVLRVGTALLQVSQPRIPCYKQAVQLGLPDAVRTIAATGRCGLYLRVLAEGSLQAGDRVELLARPHPGVTVADAHRFVHGARDDAALRARLAACPELGADIGRRLRP